MSSDPKFVYEYREVDFKEIPEILDFLEKYIFLEDTSLKAYMNSYKVQSDEQKKIVKHLRSVYTILLRYLPSFVAVETTTKEIVGFLLLKLEVNPLYEHNYMVFYKLQQVNLQRAFDAIPEKSQAVNSWIAHILDTKDLIDPFESGIYFRVELAGKLISVSLNPEHKGSSGKSLAGNLIECAAEWAKAYNVDVFYGLFTSPEITQAALDIQFYKIDERVHPLKTEPLDEEEPTAVTIAMVIRKVTVENEIDEL